MLRNFLAILAGFITVPLLALGADALVHAADPAAFPPSGALAGGAALLVLLYSEVINVIGGWVTARLAASRPVRQAVILGLIGVAIVIPVSMKTWSLTPAWFHLGTLLLTVPACWLGAVLATRRRASPLPA